jgi:hypothetical protein
MPGTTAPRSTHPPTPLDPTHLEVLASVLLEGADLGPGDPPHLLRVRLGADGAGEEEVELGIQPLDAGDHPLDALLGFEAPDDWAAIGVLATGRATTADVTPAGRARRAGRPRPVVTAHLVARDGSWASSWRPLDDRAGLRGTDSGSAEDAHACTGRIDDAVRRAMGVATAPPPASTVGLLATQWLDAVVTSAATADRRPGTREVLAAHPAVGALGLDPDTVTLRQVIAESERLAERRPWHRLRAACVEGTWPDAGLDPALAAWFDDGSFARWVLGGWPDLGELEGAVVALLPGAPAAAVSGALDAWGLER